MKTLGRVTGGFMTTLVIAMSIYGSTAADDDPAPINTTGEAVAGLEPFDELFTSFLAEHSIPGAAVCISRGGTIIYARGFGYADVEAKEPVDPEALFRIASVSKPITGVAVMQLVEQGKVSLDDNPLLILGYEEALDEPDVDPRLKRITIRHLLHHTAGFDRDQSFDPMFQYGRISQAMNVDSPPSHRAIIEFMLRQPLDFDPGSRFAYSNFGYCVLGRVIEKVRGQTYEEYVQEHVLEPVGAADMRIGRSLPEDRAEGEVCYYDSRGRDGAPVHAPDRRVTRPYVIDHEVMDSHGAWIASATDLVRFADALNDPDDCTLLSAESIVTMFAPPEGVAGHDEDGSMKAAYYGCGWNVRPMRQSANTWHMGRINGTSTLLVRRHDGLNWAVLFNTDRSRANNQPPASLIDSLMHRAAAQVKVWPEEPVVPVENMRPAGNHGSMPGAALPDFDALWDFSDPAATEAKFREFLSDAENGGDRDDHAQLLTQIARAQGLQRRFDDAHATLDQAREMIGEERGAARVRYLLERGRVWNSSGEREKARPLFVDAWEAARAVGEDGLAVDAAHMVAIVSSNESALEWNRKALDLAEKSSDPRARRWTPSLHNNLGWTHHDRGDYDTAMAHFEKALAARREQGKEREVRIAQWCIARCLRSLGKTEESLSIQRELERDPANAGNPDGFVFEEIAECLLILGKREEARPYFRKAHEILSQDAWLRESEPQRLARLKELGKD